MQHLFSRNNNRKFYFFIETKASFSPVEYEGRRDFDFFVRKDVIYLITEENLIAKFVIGRTGLLNIPQKLK